MTKETSEKPIEPFTDEELEREVEILISVHRSASEFTRAWLIDLKCRGL